MGFDGALLIDKPDGISSFGVIEALQGKLRDEFGLRKRDQPKLGHGGTLDPFATGLLIVCSGRAVKLARYFLGSTKEYEGVIHFGQSTVPGDPTSEIHETSQVIPSTREEIQHQATSLTLQPYLQTPPMHSAKKKDGKPLYELARQGIEIEREPKLCHLYQFEITSYEAPRAIFRVRCSSGTYIRTLSKDIARMLGTVGMLTSLRRLSSGSLHLRHSLTLDKITGRWDELPNWIPFDRLLEGFERAEATHEETTALTQGRQGVLFDILRRKRPERAVGAPDDCLVIYNSNRIVAIARRAEDVWSLERVFTGEN
jgi:tRNA pseudouridine55 synthase